MFGEKNGMSSVDLWSLLEAENGKTQWEKLVTGEVLLRRRKAM